MLTPKQAVNFAFNKKKAAIGGAIGVGLVGAGVYSKPHVTGELMLEKAIDRATENIVDKAGDIYPDLPLHMRETIKDAVESSVRVAVDSIDHAGKIPMSVKIGVVDKLGKINPKELTDGFGKIDELETVEDVRKMFPPVTIIDKVKDVFGQYITDSDVEDLDIPSNFSTIIDEFAKEYFKK